MQLETAARADWIKVGVGRYDEIVKILGYPENSLYGVNKDKGQAVTSCKAAAADASIEVTPCNEDLHEKRHSHRFSSQDEVGTHQRKQDSEQRRPANLVSCRCSCRKHQGRTLISVISTHRATPGKTEGTDSPQKQAKPSLQESKQWQSTQ